MAIQFILGAAGSGKSSHCVEQIKEALLQNAHENLVFLVPEQATYQIERKILADDKIGGYSNAYILSFNRLGFWLSGSDLALEPLTKTAKNLIISRILRENKSKLKVFGQLADKSGMVDKIATIITELYQCGKSSLDLGEVIRSRQASNETATKTALQKFADISLIYDEYVDIITGRFENPDAQLSVIKNQIAKSELFKDCRLWVDGFSSFTFAEYEVLAELFKTSSEARVALCTDPQQKREHIFSPVMQTKVKLEEISRNNKIVIKEPIILKTAHRFEQSEELAHIEKHIFAEDKKIKPGGAVKIINPINIGGEVEYIAQEINSLVFEHNYRYRDIALILSDVDEYAVYLRQVFADYNIPYFIDRRRSCKHHPLIHLLIVSMRIIKNGFDRVDVFAFLKNPLLEINSSDVYMLENYCISEGVARADWLGNKAWKSPKNSGFDEAAINRVRSKASKHLVWLNSISEYMQAGEFVNIVNTFLEELKIKQTLEKWQNESPQNSEHSQVYSQVMQVLNEIATIFAGDELDRATLIGSLCDSLLAINSSLIPPGQDQVTVSQVERSRLPDVKAVFVAGAIAKKFPAVVSGSSLLTDYDRYIAAEEGCELSEGKEAQLQKLSYLSYIAATRSSERLYISYPRTDGLGKKQQRADIVNSISSLFDGLEILKPTPSSDISAIGNKRQLKDYLCSATANLSKEGAMLLKSRIDSSAQLADCTAALNSALAYNNKASLTQGDLQNNAELKTSVSRLQTYASCPYKYFANYMLSLKKRELFVYDPLSKGSFYHELLDRVSKYLLGQSMGFDGVSEKELLLIAQQQIDTILKSDTHLNSVINSSLHNGYIFEMMREDVFELLRTLRLMATVSDFKLAASEYSFGFDAQSKFELIDKSGNKISLRGKIDRIDLDEKNRAVIYDYKSSSKPQVDFEKIYSGIDLQLPSYMLQVELNNIDNAPKKAIGAFFMPIASNDDARIEDGLGEFKPRKARGIYNGSYWAKIDNSLTEGNNSNFYAVGLKKDGDLNKNKSGDMFTDEQIAQILGFVKEKICQLGSAILSGEISIKPLISNARLVCEYCDYKPLCRYDRQINKTRTVYYPSADSKKTTFFELLAKEANQ